MSRTEGCPGPELFSWTHRGGDVKMIRKSPQNTVLAKASDSLGRARQPSGWPCPGPAAVMLPGGDTLDAVLKGLDMQASGRQAAQEEKPGPVAPPSPGCLVVLM